MIYVYIHRYHVICIQVILHNLYSIYRIDFVYGPIYCIYEVYSPPNFRKPGLGIPGALSFLRVQGSRV